MTAILTIADHLSKQKNSNKKCIEIRKISEEFPPGYKKYELNCNLTYLSSRSTFPDDRKLNWSRKMPGDEVPV